MLQKARWGRQQAGPHSTLLRQNLGEHAQCYISLSTVLVQDIHMASQDKQAGSYRLVPALQSCNVSSLEPAAARNCLALQESLHACSSLWNALIEGATNTYRSATALVTQQECINPNSGNGTADATSYIWQKCQACFLSALFIRSSASHGQQHSEQETVFRTISKQIPRKNWVGDHKIQAHFRGGKVIEKPDITCMQFFHILRT